MEPKIRLKGYSGEWEESSFTESFDYLKNNSLSRAELSDSGSVYNIHYGDVLISYNECVDVDKDVKTFVKNPEIARKLHQSCAIKNGDIVFADAAEDNTVGKCTEIIAKEGDAIVSGLHTIPCRPKKEFAFRYLGYYLNSGAFHDQLLPHIQGTKISSISKRALSQTYVNYPCDKKEQQALGAYFQHLDSLIQSTTKKINSLKQVKAASLQSMFPQEGETIPRVRFKGFEGEWKCVEFGSLITECLDRTSEEDEDILLSSAIDGLYLNSELFSHFRGQSNKGYRKVKKNMLILSAQNLHLGNANVNLRFEHGMVSPAYKIYYIHDCNPELLSHWIKREETKKLFLDATTSGASVCRKNIVWNDLYKQVLCLPQYVDEQKKLADYFTSLDSQISFQTQRLEKLKQIKSACLDNMFV